MDYITMWFICLIVVSSIILPIAVINDSKLKKRKALEEKEKIEKMSESEKQSYYADKIWDKEYKGLPKYCPSCGKRNYRIVSSKRPYLWVHEIDCYGINEKNEKGEYTDVDSEWQLASNRGPVEVDSAYSLGGATTVFTKNSRVYKCPKCGYMHTVQD